MCLHGTRNGKFSFLFGFENDYLDAHKKAQRLSVNINLWISRGLKHYSSSFCSSGTLLQ